MDTVDREMEITKIQINSMPPVYLHNRFDITTRRRMKNQLVGFDELEDFFVHGFNRGLLSFGSWWFTCISMIASMALAFQWMQSSFGLDIVGGSEVLTIIVIICLAFILDIVSFMLLGGLLAGLKHFFTRDRHVALLEKTIVLGSLIGAVGFGIILVQRFMEVGL